MSTGKSNAQSGHAYLEAFLDSKISNNHHERADLYASLRPGTKICLDGGCEHRLLQLHERLVSDGIPATLVYDEGHVEPPDFDGSETLTALGVGPILPDEAPRYLKKLKLWPDQRGRAQ